MVLRFGNNFNVTSAKFSRSDVSHLNDCYAQFLGEILQLEFCKSILGSTRKVLSMPFFLNMLDTLLHYDISYMYVEILLIDLKIYPQSSLCCHMHFYVITNYTLWTKTRQSESCYNFLYSRYNVLKVTGVNLVKHCDSLS